MGGLPKVSLGLVGTQGTPWFFPTSCQPARCVHCACACHAMCFQSHGCSLGGGEHGAVEEWQLRTLCWGAGRACQPAGVAGAGLPRAVQCLAWCSLLDKLSEERQQGQGMQEMGFSIMTRPRENWLLAWELNNALNLLGWVLTSFFPLLQTRYSLCRRSCSFGQQFLLHRGHSIQCKNRR